MGNHAKDAAEKIRDRFGYHSPLRSPPRPGEAMTPDLDELERMVTEATLVNPLPWRGDFKGARTKN